MAGTELLRSDVQACTWTYTPGRLLTERPDSVNEYGVFMEWEDTDFRVFRDVVQPVHLFWVAVPHGTTPRLVVETARSHPVTGGLPGRPPEAQPEAEQSSAAWAVLTGIEEWRGFRLARIEAYTQVGSLRSSEALDELRLTVTFAGTPAPSAAAPRDTELLQSLVVNAAVAATWWREPRRHSMLLDEGAAAWPEYELLRLAVSETGLYQITGEMSGVSSLLGQPSNKIKLFGNGGRLLSDSAQAPRDSVLRENAILIEDGGDGLFDRQDRILFFGRALKGPYYTDGTYLNNISHHSPFSTENAYFVGVDLAGLDGLRMAPLATSGDGVQVATTRAREYVDQDVFIFSERVQRESGLMWLGQTIDPRTSRQFTLQLEAATDAQAGLEIECESEGSPGAQWSVTVNGTAVTVPYNNDHRPAMQGVIPQGVLRAGSNTVELVNSSNARVHVNYVEINYERSLATPTGAMEFFAPQGQTGLFRYTVDNIGVDGLVFDVTDPIHPRFATGNTIVDSSWADAPRRYFASNRNRARTPQLRGIRPAQPQGLDYIRLRDPNNSAGIILLTYDEGYGILDSMRYFHENYDEEPLRAVRVRLSDVYDEFGWGVRDPVAIRDFFKYAYENWQDTLKYVLFAGDGSYDYRLLQAGAEANLMPPWEDDDSSRDDFFVIFSNNGTVPWLMSGRWPVQSNGELQAIVSKTIAYAMTPLYGPWKNTATFAADDEWKSGRCDQVWERDHILQSEGLINNVVPEYFTFKKIYEIFYPFHSSPTGATKPDATRDLLETIHRGTLIVNYAGHGNERVWTDEQLFVMDRDRNRIDNYRQWPMYLAATCSWGAFDRPLGRCFPEVLLADQRDGGVVCVAATRFTYIGANSQFSHTFYRELFRQGVAARRSFGEALLLAKTQIGGPNAGLYHVLGNPVLRLATPEYFARVTQRNDSLQALSLFSLSGEIAQTQNGPVWEDFSGIIEARVFDTEDSAAYYWCNGLNGDRLYYGLPGNAIFRGTATVANGRFNVTFRVPRDVRYGGTNAKISLYFYGKGGADPDSSDGVGIQEHLQIASVASAEQDSIPPAVSAWLEVPSFRSGDLVSSTPRLHVNLADSSGINLSGEVGHRITVRIDDTQTEDLTPYFNYDLDRYTVGSLEKVIGPLAEGEHRLTIEAWDSFNNLNQTTLTFTVGQSGEDGYAIRDLYNWPNPMTDVTSFTYFLTQDGTRQVSVKIYTLSGKLVYEMNGLGTRGPAFNSNADRLWDGRDREGKLLANGVYFYKVKAEHTNGPTAEATGKLVILR